MLIKIRQTNTMVANDEIYATAIYSILDEVYENAPWTLEQTLSDINRADSSYYLAFEKNDKVIGFLATSMIMDEIEITNIAIAKDYQHQGIADLLLKELLKHDGKFFLEVRISNQKARHLYEKNGFESYFIRKDYYQTPIEDAVLMKREK